jgi:hypothetical protein
VPGPASGAGSVTSIGGPSCAASFPFGHAGQRGVEQGLEAPLGLVDLFADAGRCSLGTAPICFISAVKFAIGPT